MEYSKKGITDFELAKAICNCPEVQNAVGNSGHPCFKVVNEQTKLIKIELERQRPEPWVGTLGEAKLLFLSSNPSISAEPGLEREDFPTYSKTPKDSAGFFISRFDQSMEKVSVTFEHPNEPNFLTRSFDGEYRSGTKNSKQPQNTWKNTYDRAKEILGSDCHPHSDYVITEIVHCKSKDGKGVEAASSKCVGKWLEQIFDVSPAPVIIALGSKVRDYYVLPQLRANPDFGKKEGYKSLSQRERALRDILIRPLGDQNRLIVFNWHPVAMEMRKLNEVYGVEVVQWLRSIIRGQSATPATTEELRRKIEDLFN